MFMVSVARAPRPTSTDQIPSLDYKLTCITKNRDTNTPNTTTGQAEKKWTHRQGTC